MRYEFRLCRDKHLCLLWRASWPAGPVVEVLSTLYRLTHSKATDRPDWC